MDINLLFILIRQMGPEGTRKTCLAGGIHYPSASSNKMRSTNSQHSSSYQYNDGKSLSQSAISEPKIPPKCVLSARTPMGIIAFQRLPTWIYGESSGKQGQENRKWGKGRKGKGRRKKEQKKWEPTKFGRKSTLPAAILKNGKIAISRQRFITSHHEIWYGDAHWPSLSCRPSKFPNFKPRLHDTTCCQTKCLHTRYNRLYNRFDNRLYRVNGVLRIRDGGRPPFLKRLNSDMSAVVQISTIMRYIFLHFTYLLTYLLTSTDLYEIWNSGAHFPTIEDQSPIFRPNDVHKLFDNLAG